MAATFDYGNLGSAQKRGGGERSQAWLGSYNPAESGRFGAALGTATVQGNATTRNAAINAAYGRYAGAMEQLAGMANTNLSGVTGMAQKGLGEYAGVERAGIESGMNMAVRGLESRNSLASQQAQADYQREMMKAQQKEAGKSRQGNMIGGLVGAAVDIGTSFIPGASAITGITKKLTGVG